MGFWTIVFIGGAVIFILNRRGRRKWRGAIRVGIATYPLERHSSLMLMRAAEACEETGGSFNEILPRIFTLAVCVHILTLVKGVQSSEAASRDLRNIFRIIKKDPALMDALYKRYCAYVDEVATSEEVNSEIRASREQFDARVNHFLNYGINMPKISIFSDTESS